MIKCPRFRGVLKIANIISFYFKRYNLLTYQNIDKNPGLGNQIWRASPRCVEEEETTAHAREQEPGISWDILRMLQNDVDI